MGPAASDDAPLPSTSNPHHHRSFSSVRVITSPPWARDEPPSPIEDVTEGAAAATTAAGVRIVTDVPGPHHYDGSVAPGSRWWTFASSRPPRLPNIDHSPPTQGKERLSLRGRSMMWISSGSWRPPDDTHGGAPASPTRNDVGDWDPHLPRVSYQQAPAPTPGWDIPWAPRSTTDTSEREYFLNATTTDDDNNSSGWSKRKHVFRAFILSNPFVPLLFRFTNITFMTATLALAIKIRAVEKHHSAMGIIGSSPTLVVIFTPLTLLHVVIAIYYEYYGRPLGLWHTSDKLAHTLSEVLFICAWSAALSLCLDNYFTTLIPCARITWTGWYSNLPRPASSIPNVLSRTVGGSLCKYQLALIWLVFLDLITYCINLVIGLFRIFQKVKFITPATGAPLGFH